MAKDSSFDVVSEVDLTEVNNAINMAMKEVVNRFDFKGSKSTITLKELTIELVTENETRLRNLIAIFEGKLTKRNINIGFFEYGKVDDSLGGNVKQTLTIKQGISKDKAKEINKAIKNAKIKVNSQIQGDQLRVSSAKKDALQETIQFLKKEDFGIVLQFENFR